MDKSWGTGYHRQKASPPADDGTGWLVMILACAILGGLSWMGFIAFIRSFL